MIHKKATATFLFFPVYPTEISPAFFFRKCRVEHGDQMLMPAIVWRIGGMIDREGFPTVLLVIPRLFIANTSTLYDTKSICREVQKFLNPP